jgi:hypothetical protein
MVVRVDGAAPVSFRSLAVALTLAGLAASGCSQTTRIGDDPSPDRLTSASKAVAVLRLGMASPNCQHVGVWLGVREGRGFRPTKPLSVIHAASLADIPVAEVELDPGEHHVISYACGTGTNVSQVTSFDRTTGLARTSYASFTLGAGEVINVGSFELQASRVGTNAFGRPVRTRVTVTDWPLADLERYKAKRPQIYARMRTRLMTPTPRGAEPDEDDCARLRQLATEGKVQHVPATCAPTAGVAAAGR